VRSLKGRYRHTVFCPHHKCGEMISISGDVSEVCAENGAPINAMDFDYGGRYAFEVSCVSGHVTRLAAPRDVQLVRSAVSETEFAPPLILRLS